MTYPPPPPKLDVETATKLNELFPDTMEGDRMVMELARDHNGFEHLRAKYWPDKRKRLPRICRYGKSFRVHPSRRIAILQDYGYLAPYSVVPIEPGEYRITRIRLGLRVVDVWELLAAHQYPLRYLLDTNKKAVWILRWYRDQVNQTQRTTRK